MDKAKEFTAVSIVDHSLLTTAVRGVRPEYAPIFKAMLANTYFAEEPIIVAVKPLKEDVARKAKTSLKVVEAAIREFTDKGVFRRIANSTLQITSAIRVRNKNSKKTPYKDCNGESLYIGDMIAMTENGGSGKFLGIVEEYDGEIYSACTEGATESTKRVTRVPLSSSSQDDRKLIAASHK